MSRKAIAVSDSATISAGTSPATILQNRQSGSLMRGSLCPAGPRADRRERGDAGRRAPEDGAAESDGARARRRHPFELVIADAALRSDNHDDLGRACEIDL